jgi:competence protein ComEC
MAWWRNALAHPLGTLRDCAFAERDRWALWLPVALAAGIGVYFALSVEPPVWLGLAFTGLSVVAYLLARKTTNVAASFLLGLLVAASLGFAIAKFRTDSVAAPILSHRIGPLGISGCIESVQAKDKSVRAVFRVAAIRRLTAPPKRIRVSFRSGGEILRPGECAHFTAILMPPPGPAEPDGYDFGRAAFFWGIGAVGFAYGKPHPIAQTDMPNIRERIYAAIQHLRFKMTARIHAALPGSTGGIAAALITGDRGVISEEDELSLRDSGLAHVLAIAGLHMALVGLGLFWTVRALLALFPVLALTQPIKKWAAVAALGSASFYLVISGAAAPATRAFVMLAMMLLSVLVDRPALSMRSLALAAAIILLIAPESLIEPGFQMSFAAVASLIAIVEWEQARALHAPRTFARPRFAALRRYLGGIATTSFVGSLATAPYAIYHFDRAAHYAVLGNLLAMPVMGFVVMPAAACSVILMPLGLEAIPLRAMGWGIETMLTIGKWVSHLPGAVSIVAPLPVTALVVLSVGGLWIALWRGSWRWLGLLPMAASLVIIFTAKPPDLLIARDGVTVAIRDANGSLQLLRKEKDKYSAAEWLKRDGDARLPVEAIGHMPEIRCDEFGCTARAPNGVLVAASSRIEALGEDCARADIVVSAVPTRRLCKQPKLVIDRFDIARAGGYAIWFGEQIKTATVEGERGLRPWSQPQRQRRKSYSRKFSSAE